MQKLEDDFDLIVGLHPDEATKEICRSAKTCDIVLVPCCNMWSDKEKNIDELIENYFRSNRIAYNHTTLPIRGRNQVYYTKNFKEKQNENS